MRRSVKRTFFVFINTIIFAVTQSVYFALFSEYCEKKPILFAKIAVSLSVSVYLCANVHFG